MEGKLVQLPKTQKRKGADVEDAKSKGWVWYFVAFVMGAMVLTAAVFTILRYLNSFNNNSYHHGSIFKKYGDALEVALHFFDVQKSGEVVDNRISWRGDSGLGDGIEEGVDLSKGMYDAGDLIKFGFPMAFTATMLSWAILEYGKQMEAVKQLEYAQTSLKWITDYLVNAHSTSSPNRLYIQVGDPELDHKCWVRPEVMTEKRPVLEVNTSFPGTDIAAETAAAMASASLVFRKINSSYSDFLLIHAQQLFTFADTYRGCYSVSIPQVQEYYNSTGYGDELLWAAAWLYHATSDESYLNYATEINGAEFANWGNPTWFTWDDKHAGAQVLLSRINMLGASKGNSMKENLELQMYRETAEEFMCMLLPDSPTASSSRTQSGLIWVEKWNALQYSMASAFLALVFSDYMVSSHTSSLYCTGKLYSPEQLRSFAISQADYVLGGNPREMSYVVGYGMEYPEYVHHRGSSIPIDAKTGCEDGFVWLYSAKPNPNVAVGALVGGPSLDETYKDNKNNRNNTLEAEPTTYNSALLVALLSGLISDSFLLQSFTPT
ncbi:endoglucanase 24-like [Euphorbia lathyris]|uniref:endoglucanase 24-like n=1 Tax=Euphorbia lathyris TaxID=212925 RepID=UPI00331343AD